MKDEYVKINKTAIQKRIEEKELKYLNGTDAYVNLGEINALKQILSQSTPLIPEFGKHNELINVLKQLEQDSTELPYINNIIKQALKNEKN
jgi:hypothetical protein